MTGNDGQPSPISRAASSNAQSVPLIKACRSLSETFVTELHARIVKSLDESMDALRGDDGDMPDPLVGELGLIRKDADQLGRMFRDRFIALYTNSIQPTSESGGKYFFSAPADEDAGLSLVDDSKLEEWLALDNLIAKIHERWSAELAGLNARFAQLLPGMRINKYRLPLGPDKFCHAFHDALTALDTDVRGRVYCYGLLDRALSSEIGGFYSQVNHFLITKGVLPSLVVEESAPEERRTRRGGQAAPGPAMYDDGLGNTVDGYGGGPAGGGYSGGGPAGHGAGPAYGGSVGGGPARGGFAGPVGAGAYAGGAGFGPAGGPGMGAGGGAAPGGFTPGMASGPVTLREQMFVAMQQLLAGYWEGGEGGIVTAPEMEIPVAPVLIDTLSSLQRDESMVERTGELIRGGLRHYVHGRFGGLPPEQRDRGISQLDDETIDVISMIFDYILDDQALPDVMKALIGRLQIPVLKVALIDRGFFRRKTHPARQLLNELAQAGSGWDDESDIARDRLYAKVESIVHRILEEFEDDIGIFETLLQDLRAFITEEAKQLEQAQQKLLEDQSRAEQVEKLRVRVLSELAARMQHAQMPEDVREFLLGAWKQYLEKLVAEGKEPAPALALAAELLWTLVPKVTAADRKRMTAMLPSLLSGIESGMRAVGLEQAEIDTFLRSLERHHFLSIKEGIRAERRTAGEEPARTDARPDAEPAEGLPSDLARSVDQTLAELQSDLDQISELDWESLAGFDDVIELRSDDGAFERMIAEMGLTEPQDHGPRIDDEFTSLVRDLALGTWVELHNEQGRPMRVRVVWKGDERTPFSFVNRQYKVVAERPLYVLADEFRRGEASIVENLGLFDRAMDGVIAGIMKLTGGSTA